MQALYSNADGAYNTAAGMDALFSNVAGLGGFENVGYYSTAIGFEALYSLPYGNETIAVGSQAGFNLNGGGHQAIEIGAPGVADDGFTIRIGIQGTQSATYIAGISGTAVTGQNMIVNSSGQLGVDMSVTPFSRDIRDMGEASSALMKLRPVTFRYKNDRSGARQYGLVAEEVERVYRELVTYGADERPQSVRYSMLTPMLLNEMQKQARRELDRTKQLQKQAIALQEQSGENQRLARQLATLSAQSVALKTSAGEAIAELKDNFKRELRSLQERLATMEQALQTVNGEVRQATAEPFNRKSLAGRTP